MASPPPLLTLTDELLEEIFLRLPGPTDLARASTACASFHRVITDRAFLRRFRGIHPPPLLGFVPRGQDGFYPAQPPYHSAPLARAVADAADFSYYFVPIGRWLKPWRPRDLRQGRVLLECLPKYDERYHFHSVVFLSDLDLAVCDPLHRRYVLLPPVPHKITAQHGLLVDFDAFLAPTGQDEEGTSFQVICTARNETNLFAIVFSSVTGHWCIAASPSWSCLGTERPLTSWPIPIMPTAASTGRRTGLASCLCLTPPRWSFQLSTAFRPATLLRATSIQLNSSEPSGEQHLERIIPLARKYRYSICGAVEGFLFLHGFPEGQHSVRRRRHSWNVPNREYLLLDVKTSELKKVCEMKHDFFSVHAYFGFPRSLSKPCI